MSQTIDHSVVGLEDFSVEALAEKVAPRALGADFLRLWGATAASNISDGIRIAALPLLAASTTSDPKQIAGVAFATQAPWLVLGLASGAIVDRFERRRIIAAAHIFRMCVVGLLALYVAVGTAPILALYAAAFLLGTAETLFDNASQVIVPELVDATQLERANGRQAMAILIGQSLLGPLVGAALFALATPAPLVIDAVILGIAAVLVLGIKKRPAPAQPRQDASIRADVMESLRWLWSQHTLRTISLAAAAVNIAVMAHIAIFVLFTLQVLGVGGVGYAVILACYAVGGVAGGWVAPRVTQLLGWRGSAVLALSLGGSAILVTAAMQGLLGVAATVWMVVTYSLRQRLTPDTMLGRVTGAHALLSWGGAALGALAGGTVAAAFGLRAPFLAGGVVLLMLAVGIAVLAVERTPEKCAA